MMTETLIRNDELASRIIDFKGLQRGKLSPTNVDAFLDLKNKLFVLVEAKYEDSDMPFGQQLGFENLVNAIRPQYGQYGIAIHATHGDEERIYLAECQVVRFYWQGNWRTPPSPVTVRQAVDQAWREMERLEDARRMEIGREARERREKFDRTLLRHAC